MTQSQKFVILSRKKKKSIKIFWKMAKNAKIFKIQMWVSRRNWPIFGRKVADRVPSSQNSGQNFFHDQISKIGDFIQESRPPPPPKKKKKIAFFFWGGGRQLYGTYPRYHLSWGKKDVFFRFPLKAVFNLSQIVNRPLSSKNRKTAS